MDGVCLAEDFYAGEEGYGREKDEEKVEESGGWC